MSCRMFGGLVLALSLLVAMGCGPSATPKSESTSKPPASAEAEHHHPEEGPHGGTIADWGGGKYHVEFTVDHDKKESVVYVLDGEAKMPQPIKADKLSLSINEPDFQTDLIAQPLDGESEGTSSRFVGTHENFGKKQEFAGTITGEVEGTPYSGDFDEKADAHGHKH